MRGAARRQLGDLADAGSRGRSGIRRADRCRCRPLPRRARRSACLRGSDADRSRGRSRSLKVPGSPSSALTAIRRGPARRAPSAICGRSGKPAPPRPRSPESSSDLEDVVDRERARAHALQQPIAAARHIGVVIDVVRDVRVRVVAAMASCTPRAVGVEQEIVADLRRRRVVAEADAGRANHAHVLRRCRRARSSASSSSPPSMAQVRLSQTRTVSGGTGASPSFTTSKWA